MGDSARKADGRRAFTAGFERATAGRKQEDETTVAAVAWELDIQPTRIRRWMRLSKGGSAAAMPAGRFR